MTDQPRGAMRRQWIATTVAILVLTAIFAILMHQISERRRHLLIPVYGKVPDFSLTESSGRSLSLADLQGKVWIADFIFTHCAGPCPIMSAQMAGLQKKLQDAPDVRLVTFSVDPERDTPQVLSEYAKQFKADTSRWFFLTGAKKAIYDLANKGFKIGATENTGPDRQPDEDTILHSTSFVLVDRDANIRGYYEGGESNDLDRLVKDTRVLSRN